MFQAKRILLLLLLSISAFNGYSQTDSVFWFAAPDISSQGSSKFDIPILLRLTSFDKATIVTITQPANSNFTPIVRNIPASQTASVDLSAFLAAVETAPGNTVLKSGLKITSTSLITAYYENASTYCNCNPEIFALKGKNALGTHFIIPTQTHFANATAYNPRATNSFEIVATEDGTTVTINPKNNIIGHVAGTAFSISLDKGETYSAIGTSQAANAKLAGSEVSSNKPIAITVKDDLLEGVGQCEDLAGDQIIPSKLAGTEYIAVKGFLTGTRNRVTIIAIEDDTKIYLNGSTAATATLNKGQTLDQEITGNTLYIRGSKPILAWHTSGFGCELAGAILPPINCTGSLKTTFIRTTTQDLGLILMVQKEGIAKFTLNGNATVIKSTDFTAVPGTNDVWYAARINMSTSSVPVGAAVEVKNIAHLFHLGIINGISNVGTRYGYFSDYASVLNSTSIYDLCSNDNLFLKPKYEGSDFVWSSGPITDSLNVAQTGLYWVNYKSNSNCLITDSFIVTNGNINYTPINDTLICANDSLLINLNIKDKIIWNDGDTSKVRKFAAPDTVWYATVNNDCPFRDSIIISSQQPQLDLGKDTGFCNLINYDLPVPDTFAAYLWEDNSASRARTISAAGSYWLEVTDMIGCKTRDSINLKVISTPSLKIAIDTGFCDTINYVIQVPDTFNIYKWENNTAALQRTFTSPGIYWLEVTDQYNCKTRDSINLTLFSSPQINLGPDTSLCAAAQYILSPGNFARYLWQDGSSAATFMTKDSGTHFVKVWNNNNCSATDTIVVDIDPSKTQSNLFIPNAFSPNADGRNDIFPFTNFTENVVADYSFIIFTRWGEKVYESNSTAKNWDGIYKNNILPEGVYIYLATWKGCDGVRQNRKGNFTLLK